MIDHREAGMPWNAASCPERQPRSVDARNVPSIPIDDGTDRAECRHLVGHLIAEDGGASAGDVDVLLHYDGRRVSVRDGIVVFPAAIRFLRPAIYPMNRHPGRCHRVSYNRFSGPVLVPEIRFQVGTRVVDVRGYIAAVYDRSGVLDRGRIELGEAFEDFGSDSFQGIPLAL